MVRLARVTRRFGDAVACAEVSFALEPGAFLTILGPSGSGKTTVLRMIAGFLAPSEGEIWVHGRPVAAVPPHRRRIGMVFQRLALFPHMTAAENVAYPLRMRGFPRAEIPARVDRYLGIVQLQGLGGRRPHELSGGQQQRVAIARALVFEPDLLLLDEPLAALDRKLREDMQLEFRRIQRELGVTTINVTHDQREALVMSDRIVVMEAGRVRQDATPREVYAAPGSRFVAGFLGVTNFLRGELAEAAGEVAVVRVAGRDFRGVRAGDGPALAPGDRVEAALRAERVRVLGPGEPEPEAVLDARVADVIFEGDRLVYVLAAGGLGGATLRAFDQRPWAGRPRVPGEQVRVGWSARDLLVYPAATGDKQEGGTR
jgi:putative spermidine/putrescine transport system ATP-binding protein